MDLFTLFIKHKAEKETEEYKRIVTDTELALQDKLALDEPISKDGVISTIQGIDVGAIVQGVVKGTGATLRDVVDTASSISAYKYNNNVDINIIDCVNATSIGNYAMSNCVSLKSVNMPSVTSVGDSVMVYCVSLASVNLSSATSIGNSTMSNCVSLTSVNLPSVTSIGSYAMSNCVSLTSVNLPSVTSVGNYAMQNCISLKSVRLGTNQVCTLVNTNAFSNTPIAKGTGYIYVPDELVEDYKVATNWSVYADQIRPMSEYVEE